MPEQPSDPREFLRALETVSRSIRNPVAKLRFIRSSLSKYESVDRVVRTVPFAPVRRALYRWLSLEGLRHLLHTTSLGGPTAVDAAARMSLLFSRSAVIGLGVIVGVSAGVAAYRLSRPPAAPLMAAPRHIPEAAVAPGPIEAPAASGPIVPAGVAPADIWLVEKGRQWELYSNGLRVDTAYVVKGTPRRYRVFAQTGGLEPTVHTDPVGLLFHTSESDVWPLEASYNENLRGSSQGLLRYVQRHRLYHYVIDRFGRVYRVVAEDSKANHAGFSVWADRGKVYLNLNHAFLGVSFETRWEGGKALPITQAQYAAGRTLTHYLRRRYDIAPEMCVTHGLTSVNPRKHLIGHHLDWARGFPFHAFGLPDQYQRPAPSVALFGFDYDDDFLKVMDEPWPGVLAAEAELAREASRASRDVEDLRHDRQVAYDRWIAEQAGEDPARDEEAERPETPAAGGVSGGTGRAAGPGKGSTSRPEGLQ
ncbi:MAG TPA: peptidoglycan recognition family protein [Vicinamibacteria bacterium]|nr:peptidoglycan recognition family protein [Vicinamibacteria bacterium]